MKRITKIEPSVRLGKSKLRVAAYARVSTQSEDQLISLEAQKNYYETRIKSNPDWEYAGLYYDEGISGLNMANRNGLNTLLSDCEGGKIDLILIKSISRFARNTAECLEAIRKLIRLNVFIYFEKENINTGDMEGELLLTIFSSLAESESRAISQNETWSIQKRFQNGTYVIPSPPFGYKNEAGLMVIKEDEAEVVRLIFSEFLAGKGVYLITKELNKKGVRTKRDKRWHQSAVMGILKNEKYKGDALFQKTFTDSSFIRHQNKGEKTQYYITDHHEAIISPEEFDAVQALIDRRTQELNIEKRNSKYNNRYPLTGKIICGECGATWKRRTHSKDGAKYHTYCCNTHIRHKDQCSQRYIHEKSFEAAFINLLNKLVFSKKVLLQPLLKSLTIVHKKSELTQINRLEVALEENQSKRQQLMNLYTKKYLEPSVFMVQNESLLAEGKFLEGQKAELTASVQHEFAHVEELKKLIRHISSTDTIERFDEAVFDDLVDHITVYQRFEIGISLKCGLTLKERL